MVLAPKVKESGVVSTALVVTFQMSDVEPIPAIILINCEKPDWDVSLM